MSTDIVQLSLFEDPPAQAAEPAPLPTAATCAGCGKPIVWGRTANGKPIPLNPGLQHVSPNGRGKRLYLIGEDGKGVQGFACNPTDKGARSGRVSHFATCPKADEFRKEAA